MRRHFEQTLNYSSVNEDWDTELRALHAGPDDAVLCVTGSGARPLAILARTDSSVVAIDHNPIQNHLLRLQLAAIETMKYEELIRWSGLEDAPPAWRRIEYHTRLAGRLPTPTRRWWDAHERVLAAGVLHAGRWERHFRRVSRLARRIWPVDTMFGFEDLGEQRAWLGRHWNTRRWRAALRLVCDPRSSRLFFGDPAFHGDLAVDPRTFLPDRMRQCLEQRLARDSFMVSLVLRGALSRYDLPPHLTEEGTAAIRDRLHRLTIVDADVAGHVRAMPGRYSRFSLSDVPSFLDRHGFGTLWQELSRAARPGARVVVREFLRRHPLPPGLPLCREPCLERELARVDRSFAYDFIIGVLEGGP